MGGGSPERAQRQPPPSPPPPCRSNTHPAAPAQERRKRERTPVPVHANHSPRAPPLRCHTRARRGYLAAPSTHPTPTAPPIHPSPLPADLRTTPNFAGWRQPDQIGTIGLHRWIRGLCEGLLPGGRLGGGWESRAGTAPVSSIASSSLPLQHASRHPRAPFSPSPRPLRHSCAGRNPCSRRGSSGAAQVGRRSTATHPSAGGRPDSCLRRNDGGGAGMTEGA